MMGVLFYSSQNFLFPFVIGNFSRMILAGVMQQSSDMLIQAALVTMGLFFAMCVFVGSGIYAHQIAQVLAIRKMKQKLFQKFVRNNLESAQSSHSGSSIASINTDADAAAGVFGGALSNFLMPVVGVVFSVATIFIIDWRMGLGALVIGLLAFFAQARFAKPMAKWQAMRLEANAESVKAISNIFAGASAIRAFNLQDKALVDLEKNAEITRFVGFKLAVISMFRMLFTTLQGWLTILLVFVLGGWLVANNEIELPMLMLMLPLAQQVTESVSMLGAGWAGLQPPITACKRVFDVLDVDDDKNGSLPHKKIDWDGKYNLKIEDMNFQYKDGKNLALKNINLDIGENGIIAFVGASGSGKSTLLRTVIGMYRRSDLGMSLGNLDFETMDIEDWRKRFAYVDQSCKLFDMTIGENIGLGIPGKADEKAISAAAERAFAHDFISSLPQGYDTDCGEKGSSLSGGQKQRIAIARALIKKSPVLVFDEATSALDSESEKYIMDTIESLRNDHTILITTHNLRNITSADMIVVMQDGGIIETGKHDELMQKSGIYTELFAQSEREQSAAV